MKTWIQRLSVVSAAAVLAACGGGSGNEQGDGPFQPPEAPTPPQPPAPPPAPPPTQVPEPPLVPAPDRIEPFDPAAVQRSGAVDKTAKPPVQGKAAPHLTGTVRLAPLAQEKAAMPQHKSGTALQIGVGRALAPSADVAATQALLQWHATEQGTQVAALRFVSPQAKGVRLGVYVQLLPAGAVLRAYGTPGQAAVEITQVQLQEMAARNATDVDAPPQEIHTWWSPDFAGEATTLEVEIPATAHPAQVQIAVPRLAHHTLSLDEAEDIVRTKDMGDAGSCNINAACRPETDLESRAVARMVYMRDGGSFLCTGTLLNDRASSGTPYFLSANHCVATQREASSLNTDWFFRSNSCAGMRPNPADVRLSGGATLLYTATATDVTLLQLHDTPPPGAAYAGSYFGAPPGAGSVDLSGLHHPQGDLQKFSAGTLRGFANCEFDGPMFRCGRVSAGSPDARFWEVSWQQGTTEGGSSGSALFVNLGNTRYVLGQLSGGSASCENPAGTDFYGRFDLAYRAALRNFLAPGEAAGN